MKKLRFLQLAAVIFLTVSGGPYGIESLLTYAGTYWALALLVIVPLLWDIPTIATVLELNSMMPVSGGYYQWVKKALGLRWAWYEGWWTWLYTFVDLAIYPVLFVEYASFFFPEINTYKIPVCLTIIWASAALNIVGIVPVGRISLFLGAIVLIPFFIMFAMAFLHPHPWVSISQSNHQTSFSSLGLGLYVVMWNFLGWDNTTTYAPEVNKPVRAYLISILLAFSVIFLIYFAAIFVAIQSGINIQYLNEYGFPVLGILIGGQWLGNLLALGGMGSALGLYSAVLLSVSRVPKAMAEDKLLPAKFILMHPKFNTPYISIIVCSVVVSILISFTFTELLIVDVSLYGAALFLEFISLIVLRRRFPNMARPFKIPLNEFGLSVMVLFPLSVYLIAMIGAFSESESKLRDVGIAVGILFTSEILWQLIKRRQALFSLFNNQNGN